MTLAKFQPNRTTGSKVMAKNLKKGTFLEPGTRDKLPGSRVPGFCQLPGSCYPVPDKPSGTDMFKGGPKKFSLCLNSGGLREKREDGKPKAQ